MSAANTAPAISPELQASIRRTFEMQQQHHWVVGRTKAEERIAKLRLLHATILKYRDEINQAVYADFGKSPTEVNISEIGVVNSEIRHAIRNLRSWMTPKRVDTPLFLVGTWSKIIYEPKGVCLIISPWNFPINLTLTPLVSAVAAGNCAIIKPSEYTPNSTAVMKKIVAECFPPEEVSLFEGDATVSQELLTLPFHHIFFTGNPAVGKIVMQAAAKHLTSVTLELGGKSPVIVDEHTDLDHAAAKTIWLKCMNAGQICIAPDYVLVDEKVHDVFVAKLIEKTRQLYGKTPEDRRQSPDLCRMISPRHYDRVMDLLQEAVEKGAEVQEGGTGVPEDRYIDPTILTRVPESSRIWQEEIFGPILPVRSYKNLREAIDWINAGERPLSMYIFSNRKKVVNEIHAETRCGGGAVNDCGLHFYQINLPFGGVNNSGMGQTHGETGFLEFSNNRGVTYQNTIFPHTNLFLPPYGSKLAKWLLEGVVKWF